MALPGFELLYSSVRPQIKNADDASVIAIHWNLISNGFRCCGAGEVWPEQQSQSSNINGNEALPQDWNSQPSLYSLRYVEPSSNRTFLMKALAMDGNLVIHFLRCFDEKASSVTIRSRDYVNEDLSTVTSAYSNLSGLNANLTKDVVSVVLGNTSTSQATTQQTQGNSQEQRQENQQGRSSLLEDPRRGGPGSGGLGYIPPRAPLRPGTDPFGVDPFGVGRSDLDPFGGGGGGMFMDPRNFPGHPGQGGPRGGFFPGGPMPPGFPPGSVPPGARFDPVGPPGARPQPDPDHEQPPDYDDMFM